MSPRLKVRMRWHTSDYGSKTGLQVTSFDDVAFVISPKRLEAYSVVAGGEQDRTLALYEWNLMLTGAFWVPISIAEISLRNALSRQLSTMQHVGGPSWFRSLELESLLDSGDEIHKQSLSNARKSIVSNFNRRKWNTPGFVPIGDADVTLDQVVSELTFGFWRYLLSSKFDEPLWRKGLAQAFRNGTKLGKIEKTVSRVKDLRNRLAHHEPIWNWDIEGRSRDVQELLSSISPAVGEWASGISNLRSVIEARPTWLPRRDECLRLLATLKDDKLAD